MAKNKCLKSLICAIINHVCNFRVSIHFYTAAQNKLFYIYQFNRHLHTTNISRHWLRAEKPEQEFIYDKQITKEINFHFQQCAILSKTAT